MDELSRGGWEDPVLSGAVLSGAGLSGALTARDALSGAASSPVWQCTDDGVEATLEVLDQIESSTAALRAGLLAEAETRALKDRTRAPSTERWLAERFRWSLRQARSELTQSKLLGRQLVVADALAAGTLTLEQAVTVATALDALAGVPGVAPEELATAAAFLIEHAGALGPAELVTAGRAIQEALTRLPSVEDPADEEALRREQDRAERAAQDRERNGLRVSRRAGGRCRVVVELGPVGEAIMQAWLHRADQPVPGVDGFADTRDPGERRGDALVEILAATVGRPTRGRSVPHPGDAAGPAPGGGGDAVPSLFDDAADDHDIDDPEADDPEADDPEADDPEADDPEADDPELEDPDAGSGASGCRASGPVSPIALLTLTVSLAELRASLTGAGVLDTGEVIGAATLRQLACDSLVVPAVMGGRSQVLDLGRSKRLFNLVQRRAVTLRDRRCAAPGCDRPPQACQVHHDWDWVRGGPTDLAHAVLLCGYHHRMVHRQSWTVRLAANGFPEFVPPPSIDPQQRPRQHVRFRLLALGR